MRIYCYHCGEPLVKSPLSPKVSGEFVYQCPMCIDFPTVIETDEELENNEI